MGLGIILASHGKFAEGLYHTASMIIGEQKNVRVVSIMPEEGPDDLYDHFQEAIASFPEDDKIIILCDLWSGSPFNQASKILKEREDDDREMVIMTGMNLPMFVQACMSDPDGDLKDIIAEMSRETWEGCKALPEEYIPPTDKVVAEVVKEQAKQIVASVIPEGTVIGDGKLKINLVRIDSRLLHGQVATAWAPMSKAERIIVASDEVAEDDLRKSLIVQAAPAGVKAHVLPLFKLEKISKDPRFGETSVFILFENPQDALRAVEAGVPIEEINVGSMAHSEGKTMVNKVLSMDKDDVETFEKLRDHGVKFDVRKVPNDSKQDLFKLIDKANIK